MSCNYIKWKQETVNKVGTEIKPKRGEIVTFKKSQKTVKNYIAVCRFFVKRGEIAATTKFYRSF
jgi:hypothetical protein